MSAKTVEAGFYIKGYSSQWRTAVDSEVFGIADRCALFIPPSWGAVA
ncbi:MAG: hypothetical protein ACLVCI_02810 [Varibaculum timonense]